MKALKLFLAFLITIISLSACTDKSNENVVDIGWIGPLTGDAAPYGIAIKRGTDLAISEINSDSSLTKLNIIYEDDRANVREGINAFNKLVTVNKPPVIIQAAASSVMLANIPKAEKEKVVYISPSCSHIDIKEGGDYIFRIWPSDSDQAKFAAEYIFSELNYSKAAIININNDFGVSLGNEFKASFTSLGGSIVREESFNIEDVDMRIQLNRVLNSDADIIFIASHVKETQLILRQAKELGIELPFFADAAAYSNEIANADPSITKNLFVVNLSWNPASEDGKISAFSDKYQNRFNEQPDIYAAAGYDLIYVLSDVINSVDNITSENVKNALYEINNYNGLTGSISFDEFGEVSKTYNVYRVRENEFTEID